MSVLTKEEYQEKISVAESAVEGVVDPQLRPVAFAKILEQLLSQTTSNASVLLAPNPRVERRVQKRSSGAVQGGPAGLIDTLVDEQFFQNGKGLRDVQIELQNRGHRIPRTSLSGPLQALCRRRRLRRLKEKTAVGRDVYVYSNW
jgi:hypothetical protein